MKKPTVKEVFTIPNIIGYVRILLIPVFCYLYLTAETRADYLWAAAVVLISSLSDLFDGMIARKFNQVTELGKILDPVADKLSHAAMAICIAVRYPLMWLLIALMAVKEGYMAIMGIRFLKKGRMLDGAMWFGKVCTAMLFVGLLVLFLFPFMPVALADSIILIMMLFMVVALCMYVPVFRKMRDECRKAEDAR